MVRRARTQGMIYLGPFDDAILAAMVRHGPPAVLLDAGACGLPCDSVCVDNASGAREAVRHLLAQGHGDALAIIAGASGDRATTELQTAARRQAVLRQGRGRRRTEGSARRHRRQQLSDVGGRARRRPISTKRRSMG